MITFHPFTTAGAWSLLDIEMIAAQTDGTVTGDKFTPTSALPKHKDAGLETPSVLIAGFTQIIRRAS
jgi:hypothetical protein